MEFQYEESAKRCDPMPSGLSWADQWAYQTIAALASRYRTGGISADQSQTEMKAIRKDYAEMCAREKLIKHTADMWRDIEFASMKYNKEHTLEAADEMRDIVYGFMRYTDKERIEHEQQIRV